MPRIDKMFAFVAVDEEGEGVTGFRAPDGMWMPMVGADMERAESLMKVAQDISNVTKKRLTLVEFSVRRDIKTIEPQG